MSIFEEQRNSFISNGYYFFFRYFFLNHEMMIVKNCFTKLDRGTFINRNVLFLRLNKALPF